MLVGMLLSLFALQGLGPPLPAPVPPPNVTVTNVLQAPPMDPEVVAETSVQASQAMIITVISPPPVEWANEALGWPDFWRTTPPEHTFRHPAVVDTLNQMREHSFWLLPLALLALAISIMLARHSGYGGRVMFAVVASAGSLIWWQAGIELNNIICAAIGAPDLPSIIKPHLTLPTSIDATEQVGTAVLTVVYAIVALMLLFSLVVRIVLIDVLMVSAPLFLMCFATPQSEGFATRYAGLATGLVFSQILIVIGLKLVSAFAAPGVGGTLLAIAVLLTLRRLPGLVSQLGQQQPAGYNAVQHMVTRRVVQTVTRR